MTLLDPMPFHACRVGCEAPIDELVREQRSLWRNARGDVMPPWTINAGDCEPFAERIVRILQAHGDWDALVVDCEFFDVVFGGPEGKRIRGDYHAWVFFRGKHYDAEAPEGVTDWELLPFFQRAKHEHGEVIGRPGAVIEDRALRLAVKMMSRLRERWLLERTATLAEEEYETDDEEG